MNHNSIGDECIDSDSPLLKMRDSRGLPLQSMPTQVLPSATVIITRVGHYGESEILIHRRSDNGWWGLIGGRQDIGESILQCAVREAKEETGYDVELGNVVCIDSDPKLFATCAYPDGNIIQYANITFIARIVGGNMALSEESKELRWVIPCDLPTPFLPAHLWRLGQFLGKSNTVTVR